MFGLSQMRYKNRGQTGMEVLIFAEFDVMTEEQTKYKTMQCFGQFERDHVTCKACGVSVECYHRTDELKGERT